MALAYDQQTVQARSSGVNSLQQTTGQAVDAGDLIVVGVGIFNVTAGAPTVTDDASQTYTEAIRNDPGGPEVGIFYVANHPGGTIKVTVNPAGASADIDFTVSEISGAATSGALDKTATNAGTGTTPNVSTGVLAQANEIIFAIMTHEGSSQALTPDGTYTQVGENENNASGQCYNHQYKIVADTASDQADWTTAASVPWHTACATFKEAAGGATKAHPALMAGPAAWCP